MNYLAHAYLSFGRPEILTGNLIADFVKGKQQFTFSPGIQAGIRLHRAIDEFTDSHEATRKMKSLMQPSCGRYSGVFTDVIYDHFLAHDNQYFTLDSLASFARQTYTTEKKFQLVFPERFRQIFQYMQQQNWLYGYYFKEGIFNSFRGIYHRAKFLNESNAAFEAFEEQYRELRQCYTQFMPEVLTFSEGYINRLSKEILQENGR